MNNYRKITAFILCVIVLLSCTVTASASDTKAELYEIYGNDMLFARNEEAVLSGTGKAGDIITAALRNSKGELVSEGSSAVKADGSFSVAFMAPEGSFEEYTVTLYENSVQFSLLKGVVFGELWLASGQSNMQYPLSQALGGIDDFYAAKKLSRWLRVLLVPAYNEYKGSTSLLPCEPQKDIKGAKWVNGENGEIYSMSAVAYYFAEKLLEELQMPVGILNSNLGGTTIRSWISREAIDSSPEVRASLTERGEYIEKSAWKEDAQNVYYDMTTNFNQKIAPLADFRISGMIWYQGESDLMTGNFQYDKYFTLLQKSYTELFGYSDGLLPIIYTQLAPYYYSDDGLILADWNIAFTNMQKVEPSSRAVVTIYDVPVTYLSEAGLIHPERKCEVGQRMALAAMGIRYDKYDTYTAASVKGYEVKDGSIYVTFENSGDKLICTGEKINGFTISSSDGVFVKAQAEIISEDTVRVYSEGVASPAAFTYAYAVDTDANLYSVINGELLPVAPYNSYNVTDAHYFIGKDWADCDREAIWVTEDDASSGYYDAWTGENAEISVNGNGLEISANSKKFSVSPTLTYKDGITEKSFSCADGDYSDYSELKFFVTNNGDSDVTFKALKLYESTVLWYAPEANGMLDTEVVIPADGNAYEIVLSLDRVYHLGNECSLSYDNEKLGNIKNLEFCFEGEDKYSDITLSEITFTPSVEDVGTRYDVNIKNADNIIEIFTAIFLTIFGRFAGLFVK